MPKPEETEELKRLRKDFEVSIQYRKFLERHKDGSYKLEWVELRWGGYKSRSELTEDERRALYEREYAARNQSGWKPSRSHAPGRTHEYEDALEQFGWVMFNAALGIKI